MSATLAQATTVNPVVLFARLDDPELAASCYLIGMAGAAQRWSPSPTTSPLAGELHRLASHRGALLDVSRLREGRCAANPRKAIRAALGRVIAQIEEASPALGRLLGDELEVITCERRVLAKMRRSTCAEIETARVVAAG